MKNQHSISLISPSVRFVLSVVEPDFIGSVSADGMKTFYHRGHGEHGVEDRVDAMTDLGGCWEKEAAA
jgi:hypothetical protein